MTTERSPQTTENIPANLSSIPWVKYTPLNKPPERGQWISEPLWEGEIARIFIPRSKEGSPIVLTEKEGDVTYLFPEVSAVTGHLSRYHSALLEVYIHLYNQSGEGKNIVQNRSRYLIPDNPDLLIESARCGFVPTELLFLDGKGLTKLGTLERKQHLDWLITSYMREKFDLDSNPWFTRDHDIVLQKAKEQGFKGLIFKGRKEGYNNHAKWKRLEFHKY